MDCRARGVEGRRAAVPRGRDRRREKPLRALRRHHPAPPQGRGRVNLASIDLSILWPAFAAGLLVTATHVPLGMQVLARGIVFIDLAIAQIAGCGVLLADRLGFEAEGAAVPIAPPPAPPPRAFLLPLDAAIW